MRIPGPVGESVSRMGGRFGGEQSRLTEAPSSVLFASHLELRHFEFNNEETE